MDSHDLSIAHETAKATSETMPLSRDQAVSLYERLDDAGLQPRIETRNPRHRVDQERRTLYVVSVDTGAIEGADHLRLLADVAGRFAVSVEGDTVGYIRFGSE